MKREYWFAAVPLAICLVLLALSGFHEYAWIGLVVCASGAVDFLMTKSSVNGMIASDVYGDAGESLWEFRSFMLMVGGPFVSLYAALFL